MGDVCAGSVAALIASVATALTGGLMAISVLFGGYLPFSGLRRLHHPTDARSELPDRASSGPD